MTPQQVVVWLIETLCQVLFLAVAVLLLANQAGPLSLSDLMLAVWAVGLVFMIGSGYLLTTAVFCFILRGLRMWDCPPWVYPLVAAVLFVGHVQLFATGWDAPFKLRVQAAGACVVFACTLIGGRFLQRFSAKS